MHPRQTGIAGIVIAICLIAAAIAGTGAVSPDNKYFEQTWARTDKPVADGSVARTWMWGPEATGAAFYEEYANAPSGERLVQYFDKSRMEITDPNADASSVWYVTNGLLVVEMMDGRMQMGDNAFVDRPAAEVPVAGDGDDTLGPTYATFASLRDVPSRSGGSPIVDRLDRSGNVTTDLSLASYAVTAAYHVRAPNVDHQVASPFWIFMNLSGTVYENSGLTTAALFLNPFYAIGYPVTEAYWAEVKVGGSYRLVLMQCFERRCLTYTPDNPAGWKVEAGNVGLHYYAWRYGQAETSTATATATATTTQTATASPTSSPTETPTYTATSTPTNTPTNTPTYTPTTTPTNTPDLGARVYVTEVGQDRIQVFDQHGNHLFTFGQYGSADGEFDSPSAIAIDQSKGWVYVGDTSNDRIQKFDLNGNHLLSWNSYYPVGVAVGPDGGVYVMEGNYVVRSFDPKGQFIRAWGEPGSANGQFVQPVGVAVNDLGTVFVADTGNDRIQAFTHEGTFIATWGSTGSGVGELDEPYQIASDDNGSLYVTDKLNNRVVKTDAKGSILLTWDGFNVPRGIALDPAARNPVVYVADTNNDRVVAFNGVTGAKLFEFGERGSGDGEFILPYGVAFYTEPAR